MKILFVANRFPFPPHRGDKIKIYNLARKLALKHELILVTFTQDKQDLANLSKLNHIFSRVETIHLPQWKSVLSCSRFLIDKSPLQVLYFRSNAFKKLLSKVVAEEQPDVVHVQHLRMSQYLNQLAGIPALLDLPDAFSMYWERRKNQAAGVLKKMFNTMEFKRLEKYELILKRFNLCVACSKEDVNYLIKKHELTNIKVLPNGVDVEVFSSGMGHDYSQNKILLFTGNMNYAPNVDGVQYFVKDILPLIHKKHPQVKFVIAGQNPVHSVLTLASEQVEVTGFVIDIVDYYKQAAVVVAPLRIGAGTQNKVLEALSMAIPVVCTRVGFEGLGIKQGEGAFMETENTAFANRVMELLDNQELRKSTGLSGQAMIRKQFDWNVVASVLEEYLKEIKHG
ncbi:MAG: glycosyltransferase family 4 protein [Bacteroidia bacterium]|nr:glycosyltransferase family 4 protein [Bacteroidia bacterium]